MILVTDEQVRDERYGGVALGVSCFVVPDYKAAV